MIIGGCVLDLIFLLPSLSLLYRGRSRRIAYIISRENSPSRLRSYMQLAEHIPLLMMDDAESQCGRFSSTEIRRRQLALSLKKVSLLSQNDYKIESIWNSLFAQANDLDENFLKKVGTPRNRVHATKISSYDTTDYGTSMTRTNSEDHLFDQTNRSSSPTYTSFMPLSSSSTIRMEGSVAVCTGRRSWSEEWAVLTGQYFSIPTSRTSKHLRLSSYFLSLLTHCRIPMIQLGQIRSVNILTEIEKPFSNYEFFTIGTAARIYYFCVKVYDSSYFPPDITVISSE